MQTMCLIIFLHNVVYFLDINHKLCKKQTKRLYCMYILEYGNANTPNTHALKKA